MYLVSSCTKKNYWHKACGTEQKRVDIQVMMNRAGVKWSTWPRNVRVKLGNIMVDCVLKACAWFETVTINRNIYLVPTAVFADNMDKIIDQARFFSAEQWPMLVPPNDWTPDSNGGYILDEVMRGHDLVRRGNPTRIQGEHRSPFSTSYSVSHTRLTPSSWTLLSSCMS